MTSIAFWLLLIIPLALVLYTGLRSRKYVHGVADFLAAGRVAGRYVISVGDMQTALGVITLISLMEQNYQCGFAMSFWNSVLIPLGSIIALTGYCGYRFRETRALSLGQFVEMRYSRSLRVVASLLRTLTEMVMNAIGPAVAARFFIYLLGIPDKVQLLGYVVPTYALLLGVVLLLALLAILPGGRVSLLITDAFQGMMSYPIFVIITVFILLSFPWKSEIEPVLMNHVQGESFIDPIDVQQMRDFNVFALVVSITTMILNHASWFGNDTSNSGRTPHEQKMAGILGTWRNGFSTVMMVLLAVAVITVMNHANHASAARDIRQAVLIRAAGEILEDSQELARVTEAVSALPELRCGEGNAPAVLSRGNNLDTITLERVHSAMTQDAEGNKRFQKIQTLYYQMLLPGTFGYIMPPWMLGLFCLLAVMLMLSTDDSRIFNSASTLVQDFVLPMRKRPLSPQAHLRWLRWMSVAVAVFFFVFSLKFSHMDFISMFLTIAGGIWLGGAGPMLVFGLYSRKGTTSGAYASLCFGAFFSVGGLLLQRNWADVIYPWIMDNGLDSAINGCFERINALFGPYIVWKLDSVKFPVNSTEMFFFSMVGSTLSYLLFSWMTCRHPFDLDRMLHRGKWADADTPRPPAQKWTLRNILSRLIGIDHEYTHGDKVIAWSIFLYTFLWQFGIMFLLVLAWNGFSPWESRAWSNYFLVGTIITGIVIGVVSTIWFTWGGVRDMRQLFFDLEKRRSNPDDNGEVK